MFQENSEDLERTQKSFVKMVLKNKYKNYEDGLEKLNLDTLADRREKMSLKFAKDGIENHTLTDILKNNENFHTMETRYKDQYDVQFANTERLKKSSVIHLQNLLNEDNQKNKTKSII